jgi:GTP-binding protein HflX
VTADRRRLHDPSDQPERAYLVGLILPDTDIDPRDPLGELRGLAESAGAVVVGEMVQKRAHVDSGFYIGRGKAAEVAAAVEAAEADVVIFDNELSPGQIRDLEEVVKVKVIDRSVLILDIFAKRARTHAAKLQVELAQMEYTFPRLTRMWSHLERVGGGGAGAGGAAGGAGGGAGAGIGTRGPGEQQLEIDRRIVKRKVSQLKHRLEEIANRREREVRSRKGEFTVGLVGYTNAGKSTLMNSLTGAGTYAADQLFATLDTKTRRWDVGHGSSALLSDTVGFVRDLPHHLVASFKATLEEATHADLLLHVVDASHPRAEQQMEAVESVLSELHADDRQVLLVFNKIDAIEDAGRLAGLRTLYPEAVGISAKTGRGLAELTAEVYRRMNGRPVEVEVEGDVADGRALSVLHSTGEIVDRHYDGSAFRLRMRVAERELPRLYELNGGTTVRRLDGADARSA